MDATQLKVKETARIIKIHCPIKLKRRLFQMGIYEQALIRLDRRTPLGDPLIFEVEHCHFALRKSLAKQIEVRADE